MDRQQLLLLAHCLPSYQLATISAPTATKYNGSTHKQITKVDCLQIDMAAANKKSHLLEPICQIC